MARNEEKAQSMLNRYLRSKSDDVQPKRRPYRATLCDDVDEAEQWLRQVMREIHAGVSDIQNEGLAETRVRELNDTLNRLLKERRAWERRIRALGGRVEGDDTGQGGRDWRGGRGVRGGRGARGARGRRGRRGGSVRDGAGGDDDVDIEADDDVIEVEGYFYFGAARNLPGVREVMQRARERARGDEDEDKGLEDARTLQRRVDAAYFGEGERGDVRQDARRGERELRMQMVQEWEDGGGETVDKDWDDSFKQFIGVRPKLDDDEDVMRALLLERKKAEAIEQLNEGARSQR